MIFPKIFSLAIQSHFDISDIMESLKSLALSRSAFFWSSSRLKPEPWCSGGFCGGCPNYSRYHCTSSSTASEALYPARYSSMPCYQVPVHINVLYPRPSTFQSFVARSQYFSKHCSNSPVPFNLSSSFSLLFAAL